ncbi:MAG: alpha/beta hydrolase [Rhodospirillaceae bacterium]|nr:alpha/beta hydrolase [Rhodospirillaceae bacterium]
MPRLTRATAALAILLAFAAPAMAQLPTPVAGVVTEVLALPAPKTLRDGAAVPGWDNEPLMALRFTPAAGDNPYGPALVFVDEGPASHPATADLATRFAAERLAAKGYTAVSIFSRINRGYGNMRFENGALDIKAAVDFLEARGHEDIVLAGHGFGAVMIAHYIATAEDAAFDMPGAKRVKAAVMFAPPADDLKREAGLEGNADALVKQAQDAMAAGQGRRAPSADGVAPQRRVIISHGGMMQSPEAFLSFYGPDADTNISKLLPRVATPLLLLAGARDETVPTGRLAALKARASASPRVETITYSGTGHDFAGHWDRAADDVAAWLAAGGLGVRPRVVVSIIDARMDDGAVLPGMLYLPEGTPPTAKPAFILQHGTGGDALHSATQWLAWRLAQAGHAVLSPRTRMSGSRGLEISTYAEQVADLGAWVDALDQRGYARVILEGHSLGGILVSNYKARTQDPRVIGLVYLAPTRDSPVRAREGAGDAVYAAVVKEARDAVARGDGLSHVVQYPSNLRLAKDNIPPGRDPIVMEAGLAAHFLDFRGPDAPLHTQVVGEFAVPSLTIAGTRDPLMTKAFVDQFAAAHKGKADVVWIENGEHNGRESKNRYRDEILAWVARSGW